MLLSYQLFGVLLFVCLSVSHAEIASKLIKINQTTVRRPNGHRHKRVAGPLYRTVNAAVFTPSIAPENRNRCRETVKCELEDDKHQMSRGCYLITNETVVPMLTLAVKKIGRKYLPHHAEDWMQLYALPFQSCHNQSNVALQTLRTANKTYDADDKMDLFIGPGCDYALATTARILQYWKIPTLAIGLSDDFKRKYEYPTLTRVYVNYDTLKDFLTGGDYGLMPRMNWTKYTYLYEVKFDCNEVLSYSQCRLFGNSLINDMQMAKADQSENETADDKNDEEDEDKSQKFQIFNHKLLATQEKVRKSLKELIGTKFGGWFNLLFSKDICMAVM